MKEDNLMNKFRSKVTIFLSLLLSAAHLFCAESTHEQKNSRNIKKELEKELSTQEINQEFAALLERSKTFDFPTQHNKISIFAHNNKIKQAQIVAQAKEAYPFMHKKISMLIDDFLCWKKEHGTAIEQALYKNMSKELFIDRLLKNRPLVFVGPHDQYLLRNKVSGSGGFESIGKDTEKFPLILKDYLSYDEMQISALLGVFVPTYFINDGERYNQAKKGIVGSYQEEGISIGLVGARFEKPGLMESQHILITRDQNTKEHGYGLSGNSKNNLLALWEDMYGEHFPTFKEAQNDTSGRYITLSNDTYFDSVVYKKRMNLVLEPFLLSAHAVGLEKNKKVYVHAVGLGLGVWQISPIQAGLIIEVYADIIKKHELCQISDIDFSWFPKEIDTIAGVAHGKNFKINNNDIIIHFSKRNPSARLLGEDSDKLLCASYAWDGNAYPGNEYWMSSLYGSGDPAAACSSTIAQLQNPDINFSVSGKNIKFFS